MNLCGNDGSRTNTSMPSATPSPGNPDPGAVEALLAERGVRYVSFEDWQAIDQAEVGRGEPHGRPRVKFVRVEEMLDTVGERLAG